MGILSAKSDPRQFSFQLGERFLLKDWVVEVCYVRKDRLSVRPIRRLNAKEMRELQRPEVKEPRLVIPASELGPNPNLTPMSKMP